MAEIKIEKKEKPIWPWIILVVIIIAALLWWVLADDPDDDKYEPESEMVEPDEDDAYGDGNNANDDGALNEYWQYANRGKGEMGLQHEYTHMGINLLAEAISEVNDDLDNKVDTEVQQLKNMGDRIMKDTYDDYHADTIKKAFMMASKTIEKMMENNNIQMNDDLKDLSKIAGMINKDELATNQQNAVNRFFNKSASALKKIHETH